MLGLLIYVVLSASGLILIKLGLKQSGSFIINKMGISLSLDWILILGVGVYVISFILSMIVMKKMNITIFYPLSAGLIYVVVCLLGIIFLKEKLAIQQFVGIGLILSGIILMNITK